MVGYLGSVPGTENRGTSAVVHPDRLQGLGMRSIHRVLYNCVVILEDLTILALLGLALGWLSMLWWKSGHALYWFLMNFAQPR
jgi:hypothetical protein